MSAYRFIGPGVSAFARALIVSAITVATLAGYRDDSVARQPIVNPMQDSPNWLAAAVEQHLGAAGMSTPTTAEYVKTTWRSAQNLVQSQANVPPESLVYVVALHYRHLPDPTTDLPNVGDTEDTTTVVIDSATHHVLAATELEPWVLDMSAIATPRVLQFG